MTVDPRVSLRAALIQRGPTDWVPDPGSVEIDVLAEGSYHTSYLIHGGQGSLVARWNRSSQWGLSAREQLRREYAVLRDLSAPGVTPVAYELLGDAEPFLLESLLVGQPFDYLRDVEPFARALARVHGCTPAESVGLLPDESPEVVLVTQGEGLLDLSDPDHETVGLLRSVATALRRLPKAPPMASTIIHTDLIQSNILRSDDRCLLLDWEGARIGPAAWDIAYHLSPVTVAWARPRVTLTAADRARFVTAYADASGARVEDLADEVERLMPFVMFRQVAWCVHHLTRADEKRLEVHDIVSTVTAPDSVRELFAEVLG